MPTGIYIRTKKTRENLSKSRIGKAVSMEGVKKYWKKRGYVGKNNPNYKHGFFVGVKARRKRHQEFSKYEKWRMAILERDNFTCQCCKTVGRELNVHHIKSIKDFPELEYEIDNGITLCERCHSFTSSYGKK